uniref:Uncharacterized protein n=1 Tax=Anguilla anguilla TaxID=7936 RepID=A0A0E9VW87_ANGAN
MNTLQIRLNLMPSQFLCLVHPFN